MQAAIRVCFDASVYTPEAIASAAKIINAMSPLEQRGGPFAYAAAIDFHYQGTDPLVRRCAFDGGDCLRQYCCRQGNNFLSDFHVNVGEPFEWHITLEFRRLGAMSNAKNTVLMMDASPWIGTVEALLDQLNHDTGVFIPPEMVLSDTIDTIVGFQSRPLTLESIDYFLMTLEEQDAFFVSTDPKRACVMMMEDKANDTIREACQTIGPYIEQMVLHIRQQRNGQADCWVVYRLSNVRFAIEVGDGSQSIQNRHFSPPPNLRRHVRMEESWFARMGHD